MGTPTHFIPKSSLIHWCNAKQSGPFDTTVVGTVLVRQKGELSRRTQELRGLLHIVTAIIIRTLPPTVGDGVHVQACLAAVQNIGA